jgi:four helix bundle protein
MKSLPHHKLVAFEVARDLLVAVIAAKIADPKLRDQAMRAAKSACLNVAEGAGRMSVPDRSRIFAIARGEACEAAAAVEIAAIAGDCTPESSIAANELADRLVALLTGLIRLRGSD